MNPGEEHRWSTIREQAIDLFGDTPGAQLEQDITSHFAADPDRAIRTIHRIANADNILSKWAVVRADLNRTAQADIVASNTKGRQRLIDNAKRWIDHAGLHYDRPDHVTADLFGDDYARGPLTNHDTPQLRAELTAYWQAARPRGVVADRDHIAWNETAKANRAILQQRKETTCSTPEPRPSNNSRKASTTSSATPNTSPSPTSPPQQSPTSTSSEPSTRSSTDSTNADPSEDIDFTPEPTFATSDDNG
jgi:hypothetical protein